MDEKILLFADGAANAALWTAGSLLLSLFASHDATPAPARDRDWMAMAGKLPARKRSNVTAQVEYATDDGWWHGAAGAEETRAPEITPPSEHGSTTGATPSIGAMLATIAAVLAGTVYLILIVRRSRQFFVAKERGGSGKNGSVAVSWVRYLLGPKSLDPTWLAGVASFLVALTFQSLSDLIVASRTQERIYVFLSAVCLERTMNRLKTCAFSPSITNSPPEASSPEDGDPVVGESSRAEPDSESRPTETSDRALVLRDSGTSKKHESQIAIYSEQRVAYPDGTPADVPAGECAANVPPGYVVFYKKNRDKAQSKYLATQEWRRTKNLHAIHTINHQAFSRMKEAYPHVIHGHTKDGMLVVHEAPGKMKMKECMREAAKYGGTVDDLLVHYCYFMEYMSNIETILEQRRPTPADDDDAELASYVDAKQKRIRDGDPVPYAYSVVMDISGVGLSILSRDVLDYCKRSGEINNLHYPTSLRRIVVTNVPRMAHVAWNTIKAVIPEGVEIELLNVAQTKEGGLKKYIDEGQLPKELGGTSEYGLGEHPFERGMWELVRSYQDLPPELGGTAERITPRDALAAVGRDRASPADGAEEGGRDETAHASEQAEASGAVAEGAPSRRRASSLTRKSSRRARSLSRGGGTRSSRSRPAMERQNTTITIDSVNHDFLKEAEEKQRKKRSRSFDSILRRSKSSEREREQEKFNDEDTPPIGDVEGEEEGREEGRMVVASSSGRRFKVLPTAASMKKFKLRSRKKKPPPGEVRIVN